jgi:mono/diheme cytochrome c family protein
MGPAWRPLVFIALGIVASTGQATAQQAEVPAQPGATASVWTEGDITTGEAIYLETCSSCHSTTSTLIELIDGNTLEAKADLLWQILAGHFVPEESARRDVIAYILTVPGGQMQSPTGAADRGEMVYAANCVSCHASSSRLMRQVPGRSPQLQGVWLQSFLSGHHAEDDAARSDVIAYILDDQMSSENE